MSDGPIPYFSGDRGQVSRRFRAPEADGRRRRVAAGPTLAPQDLASYFGVSASPVRDALVRLSAEGLVDWRMEPRVFQQAFRGRGTTTASRDAPDLGERSLLGPVTPTA
ncbi:GntR family transcriptional regulator [Caulobacter segnis]